jgi:hypothetical protein
MAPKPSKPNKMFYVNGILIGLVLYNQPGHRNALTEAEAIPDFVGIPLRRDIMRWAFFYLSCPLLLLSSSVLRAELLLLSTFASASRSPAASASARAV